MKTAKFITETSSVPDSFTEEFTLAHQISGRVRYKVFALYKQPIYCAYISRKIKAHPSVQQVKAQPLTGSLTIQFCEAIDFDEQLIDRLRQALAELGKTVIQEELIGKQIRFATRREEGEQRSWHQANEQRSRPINAVRKPDLFAYKWESIDQDESSKANQPTQNWWLMDKQDALTALGSHEKFGLSQIEVKSRQELIGLNRMASHQAASKAEIWRRQVMNPQTALLAGAAILSGLTGGLFDIILVSGVVGFNCVLGYVTESHAEQVINSIGTHSPQQCRVIRDGQQAFLPEEQLVPGDIVWLDSGLVPADMRLVFARRLMVDESALTGESLPVSKHTEPLKQGRIPIAERSNMVYRGTIITAGQAIGLVTETGVSTEIGRVRQLVGETAILASPLQKNLSTLGQQTVVVSSLICSGVFLVGLMRGFRFTEILKTSISLAVAAVPEGLPTIGTSTLALGVQRLKKRAVLARQLPVVETLGAVNVICLDKTGTLTINRMISAELMLAEHHLKAPFAPCHPDSQADLVLLASCAVLCNDSYLKADQWQGSSTELAFIQLAADLGLASDKIRQSHPRIRTRYRTENRQYMVTFHQASPGGKILCAFKGNPTQLIEKCAWYQKGGEVLPMNPELRQDLLTQNEELASKALRVLAVAYIYVASDAALTLDQLQPVWLGLVGLKDPTRDGLKELIASIHQSHIQTVMMTGDQSATARAIGEELKLANNDQLKVVDAKELFLKSPEEIDQIIEGVHVFSRVSPSEKLMIVQALQRRGHIVAMTGDGINDSPALKASNVGIAMGKHGSLAAQESADLILETDDLDVLYEALKQGRSIRSNLRRSIRFLLATNLSEIILMFSSIALGRGSPLNPIQLLWINLLTDAAPAMALALEKPRNNVMDDYPIAPTETIFDAKEKSNIFRHSMIMTSLSLLNYEYAHKRHRLESKANTQVFLSLTTSQSLYTLNSLHRQRFEFMDVLTGGRRHQWLQYSLVISLGLIMLGVRSDSVRALLKNETLDTTDLVIGIGSSILSLTANELVKKS